MPREYATQGIGFQVADVVPADFLNRLDDLLIKYSDSAIATHTGTQVYVQATTGDEAQIAIDRRYFINDYDVLVDLSGPSFTYKMYAVASAVPSSNSTQISNFDVIVSTSAPSYEYVRQLGTVDWDGSQVSNVWNTPRQLNVEQVAGNAVSDVAQSYPVIPIASSNGKLSRSFIPSFSGDAQIGEVIDYWYPPGGIFSVPSGWSLCDGSVLGVGAHDFGEFEITLPDLRDKFVVGADPSKVFEADSIATNSIEGAPGIGGGKATHFAMEDTQHAHTLAAHSHVATHRHAMASHFHYLPTHTHKGGYSFWDRANLGTEKRVVISETLGPPGNRSASAMSLVGQLKTVPTSAGDYTNNVGYANPSTDAKVGILATAGWPVTDSRPWFIGFAKIMKTREV